LRGLHPYGIIVCLFQAQEDRMSRTALSALALALTLGVGVSAQQPRPAAKPLTIYIVDAEGGSSKLFVAPSGESLLIDTGNPGERDLNRIMEAIHDAGLTKLDYLLLTHYHLDHVGNVLELAKQIPIGTFIDHGPTVEGPVNPNLREQVPGFQAAYAELYAKAKHIVAKPGDRIPIAGLDWRIAASAGQVLKTPLPGGGIDNPGCAEFQPKEITTDPENGQSVASVITLGQFKAIEFGDLLWNKEFELMCPKNPIGKVDLYLASHHGIDWSGSPALVHGIQPRVAIQENGTRKGGTQQTFMTLETSPGFEDMWQAHWSYNGGIEYNAPGIFIANVDDAQTIAGILTAPPRGGGPGGFGGGGRRGAGPGAPGAGPGAAAPGAGAPAPVPGAPQGAVPPPQAGAPAGPVAPPPGAPGAGPAPQAGAPGAPGAPAPGAGRAGGRGGFGGAAAAHTPAYWLKVEAHADGSFTVINPRNGFSKTYTKK
jgi:beta-lactamase superfamily II metal-dependent hydrolase